MCSQTEKAWWICRKAWGVWGRSLKDGTQACEWGKLNLDQVENWLSEILIPEMDGLRGWINPRRCHPMPMSWHLQKLSSVTAEWMWSFQAHICPPEFLDKELRLCLKNSLEVQPQDCLWLTSSLNPDVEFDCPRHWSLRSIQLLLQDKGQKWVLRAQPMEFTPETTSWEEKY